MSDPSEVVAHQIRLEHSPSTPLVLSELPGDLARLWAVTAVAIELYKRTMLASTAICRGGPLR
jgi:hypothetical protein